LDAALISILTVELRISLNEIATHLPGARNDKKEAARNDTLLVIAKRDILRLRSEQALRPPPPCHCEAR